jgi:chlorophyll synthase
LGIAIVNDFKSIEGDRAMGLQVSTFLTPIFQTFLLYAFTSSISCLGKQHLMFKLVLQSLPVAFGIDTAKWICVGSIDVTQLSVAGEYFLNQWMRFVSLHNF